MSINIITGFDSSSREQLDKRSGPYASTTAALAALDTNNRAMGLPIYVITNGTQDDDGNYITGDVSVYNFDGGIGDANFIIKSVTSKISNEPTGSTAILNLVEISEANHASAVTAGTTVSTTLYAIPV
jgi:hypothetical protein